MAGSVIFEVDEERMKARSPSFSAIPSGSSGDIVIEGMDGVSKFSIFGMQKVLSPRKVVYMSRIEKLTIQESVLTSAKLEQRQLSSISSTHPEEVQRYWSYARMARGEVLVYGISLGLFIQMSSWKRLLAIEPDPNIHKLVSRSFIGSGYLGDTRCFACIHDKELSVPAYEERKFDCIFLDPHPYMGSAFHALFTDDLPKINRLALLARKHLRPGGRIMVKGYADLVKKYQDECQVLVNNFMALGKIYLSPTGDNRMSELFAKWAWKNRKRVLEKKDWKFINAWARHTAVSVT